MRSNHHSQSHKRSWLWSPAGLTLLVFLGIGAFFLLTEHTAHTFGALPYLLLFVAYPLMHLFMHGGHEGHGGRTQHGGHPAQNDQAQHRGHPTSTSTSTGQADQDENYIFEGEFYTAQNSSVGQPYSPTPPAEPLVSAGQSSPARAASQSHQDHQNRPGHCH